MKNKCPYCNIALDIPDKYADKEVKCPKCQGNFRTNPEDTKGVPLKAATPPPQSAEIPEKHLVGEKIDWSLTPKTMPLWSVVKNFFLFRIYIFPWIVIGTFALFVALAVMGAVLDLLPEPSPTTGYATPYLPFGRQSPLSVFQHKWLMICIGLLWLRVVCEWLIIIFRIYSKIECAQTLLESISAKLGGQPQNGDKNKGE
jgi:hypothetical protein